MTKFSPVLMGLTLLLFSAHAWALGPRLKVPDVDRWFTASQAGVMAADLTGITTDRIQREWAPLAPLSGEFSATCEKLGYSSADCHAPLNLPVLLQLNLRAADLWSRVVDCNGGTAGAEKARRHYFEGHRLCDDANAPRGSNESLVAELKALARNFQDFLLTSPYDRERGEGTLHLPVLHPLLAEMATEAVAATLYMVQQRSWSSLAGTYLLPAGQLEVTMQLIMCEVGTHKDQKDYEICYRDGRFTPNYWPRTYQNALRILRAPTNGSRDCSRFGLWPNAAMIASSTMIGTGLRSITSTERGQPFLAPSIPPNADMPTCWVGSEEIAYRMNSVWALPYNAHAMDVLSQHTHFVANVLKEYLRIREAWLN